MASATTFVRSHLRGLTLLKRCNDDQKLNIRTSPLHLHAIERPPSWWNVSPIQTPVNSFDTTSSPTQKSESEYPLSLFSFLLLVISTVSKCAILWILLVSNKTEKDLATKLLELFLSAPFLWAVLLFSRCEVERQETKIKLWMKSMSPRARAVVTTYLLDSVSNSSFASWLKFYWKVNSDWNISPDMFLVSVEWPTCCSP